MGINCSTNTDTGETHFDDDENLRIVDILMNVNFISSLKTSELNELAKNMKWKEFKKGEFIMKYGEDGYEFYVIISGTCAVKTEDGSEIAKISAGDYVGEMALLEKAKRSASVECLEDCSTLVASKELFESVLSNSSKIRFKKRYAKRTAVYAVIKDEDDAKWNSRKQVQKSEKQIKWLLQCTSDNILFSNLEQKAKIRCINTMYKENVRKDKLLIEQGDTQAQTFHVVDSGTFTIHVDGEQVAIYKQGMCFGELALIHDAPRTATVTAVEDSVIWTMHRNAFRRNVRFLKQQEYWQRINWLTQVNLFSSLTKGQLGTMSAAFDEKTYKRNAIIIKEGAIGNMFFVIKSGDVKWVTLSGESGSFKPGAHFGARALIYNQKRTATIIAITTTVCLQLHKDDFQELLGPLVDEMKQQIKQWDTRTERFVRNTDFVAKTRGGALLKGICSLDQLKTIGILGKGAFGAVSLVIDTINKKPYALKAMQKCEIVKRGFEAHVVNEKDVMLLLHNDFLVNLRSTFKDKLRVYLLLDVCLGGELFTILRQQRYFDENTSKFMTACVVEALGYMHSLNVIYRDLKPENLVLDTKGFLKVTDFGFAKQIMDQTYTVCGTPEYFAPELVTGQGHGKGVDWWTLGILIYEMLASYSPFFDVQPIGIYRKIIVGRMRFPRHFSRNARDLIKSFLKSKPTKRLGVLHNGDINKIRQMRWFNGFSWADLRAFKMLPPIIPKVKSMEDISNFKSFSAEKDDAVPILASQEFDFTF